MENQPYRALARLSVAPNRWFMHSVASRAAPFIAADLPTLKKPSPVPAAEPAPAPPPVRSAQVVNPLTMMKALASRPRLTAIELYLDESSFTATALKTPVRMSVRRIADHLKMLCRVGVLQRRRGVGMRETEHGIEPRVVRRAEDSTAILYSGRGESFHFRARARALSHSQQMKKMVVLAEGGISSFGEVSETRLTC